MASMRRVEDVAAEEDTSKGNMFWVGVGCAIGGNFLSSLSFQLQRLAHKGNEKGIPYTRIPQWWLGFFCMALGEVGNFLAYGMAPASLVSPLGAVAVVSNAVLSRIVLKEELSWRTLAGVMIALAGSVLIAMGAPQPQNEPIADDKDPRKAADAVYDSLITWRAFIYLMLVLFFFFVVANPREWSFAVTKKMREKSVIWNCILCGLMGAITVSSSKGVSTALNQGFAGNADMFKRGNICWLTYVLIIAAVGSIMQQLKYLNEALMHFGSSQVVPVYYVIFTSITISAGMVLFLELVFKPMALGMALFVCGILGSFGGVYLIATVHAPEETEPGKQELRLAQAMAIDPSHINEMTQQLLDGADDEEMGSKSKELNFSRVPSLGQAGVRETFEEMDVGKDGRLDAGDLAAWAAALREEEPEQARLAEDLRNHFMPEGEGSIGFGEFEGWYHGEFDGELQAVHEAHKQSLRQHRHHLVLAMRIQSKAPTLAVVAGTPGLQMVKTLFLTAREVQPTLPPIPEPDEDEEEGDSTQDIEAGVDAEGEGRKGAGAGARIEGLQEEEEGEELPAGPPALRKQAASLRTSSSLTHSASLRGIMTGAVLGDREPGTPRTSQPGTPRGTQPGSVVVEVGEGRRGRWEGKALPERRDSHRSAASVTASEPDPDYTSPQLRAAAAPPPVPPVDGHGDQC